MVPSFCMCAFVNMCVLYVLVASFPLCVYCMRVCQIGRSAGYITRVHPGLFRLFDRARSGCLSHGTDNTGWFLIISMISKGTPGKNNIVI